MLRGNRTEDAQHSRPPILFQPSHDLDDGNPFAGVQNEPIGADAPLPTEPDDGASFKKFGFFNKVDISSEGEFLTLFVTLADELEVFVKRCVQVRFFLPRVRPFELKAWHFSIVKAEIAGLLIATEPAQFPLFWNF